MVSRQILSWLTRLLPRQHLILLPSPEPLLSLDDRVCVLPGRLLLLKAEA